MPPPLSKPPAFVQFRVARPTSSLTLTRQFYGPSGLGLPEIGSFSDHAGYSGVMFGLPDATYHLEFTEYTGANTTPPPSYAPPSGDNLLVFYMPHAAEREATVARLVAVGGTIVQSENPYWDADGVTVEDLDGWRVVLQNSKGLLTQP
ncbi:glyoxylase family protein [Fimicolochytrium jonesii]|uniref:glyoxylase family protein n=1 Tax=Fimicolochytrium jonesii TaxID=1396493 RepID=UPI0022FEAEEE|nr:glyoxylase family protein [Fimicolochytrium jonesii]KAI8818663.1 glyoxylase family protein [Fimicolochytrium jonesii]